MRTPKMTTCKKCHRRYSTMSEVSVCPSCGTTNICYTHVMNDVASVSNKNIKKIEHYGK